MTIITFDRLLFIEDTEMKDTAEMFAGLSTSLGIKVVGSSMD
jgi:hypothetical protein